MSKYKKLLKVLTNPKYTEEQKKVIARKYYEKYLKQPVPVKVPSKISGDPTEVFNGGLF